MTTTTMPRACACVPLQLTAPLLLRPAAAKLIAQASHSLLPSPSPAAATAAQAITAAPQGPPPAAAIALATRHVGEEEEEEEAEARRPLVVLGEPREDVRAEKVGQDRDCEGAPPDKKAQRVGNGHGVRRRGLPAAACQRSELAEDDAGKIMSLMTATLMISLLTGLLTILSWQRMFMVMPRLVGPKHALPASAP